jgi:threonine/homoserine/homoserine lactone efflux protein
VRIRPIPHSEDVTHALVTFAVAASVLVMLPGPDTLLVLRSIVVRGRRTAVATAAGVTSGLVIWVGAAALGLSALLRASHVGYTVLRVAGAAYLVTLGVQALRARAIHDDHDGVRKGHGVLGVGYRAGLVTNLLNPKIGVFFVTFLPGFVPAGEPVAATSLLLGAVFVAEGVTYFAVLLVLADRVGGLLRRPTVRRRLERLTGVVLLGFGVRLITDS